MVLRDEFVIETQAVIPSNEGDRGLMNLMDGVSSLVKNPSKQAKEQFFLDLRRLPIKINVKGKNIERNPVKDGNLTKITSDEFEQLKLNFNVRDEISGLHQGLGGMLRLFLNDNYILNEQSGIFSFAENLKTVTLENNENIYSINIKIPIHGLDQGFNRWILDKTGTLKKINLGQISHEFSKYVKDENLKSICTATLVAAIDLNVTPPKAMIKVIIESDCSQFKYNGPTHHSKVAIKLQTHFVQNNGESLYERLTIKPVNVLPKLNIEPISVIPIPTSPAQSPDKSEPINIEQTLEELRSIRNRARMLISVKPQSLTKHAKEKIQTPQSTGGKVSSAAQFSIQFAIDMNKFLKEKILKSDKGFQVSLGESRTHQNSPLLITIEPHLQDTFNALVKALHVCGYQVIENRNSDRLQLMIKYKTDADLVQLEEKFNTFFLGNGKQKPSIK